MFLIQLSKLAITGLVCLAMAMVAEVQAKPRIPFSAEIELQHYDSQSETHYLLLHVRNQGVDGHFSATLSLPSGFQLIEGKLPQDQNIVAGATYTTLLTIKLEGGASHGKTELKFIVTSSEPPLSYQTVASYQLAVNDRQLLGVQSLSSVAPNQGKTKLNNPRFSQRQGRTLREVRLH